jgi:hypothetical protein
LINARVLHDANMYHMRPRYLRDEQSQLPRPRA